MKRNTINNNEVFKIMRGNCSRNQKFNIVNIALIVVLALVMVFGAVDISEAASNIILHNSNRFGTCSDAACNGTDEATCETTVSSFSGIAACNAGGTAWTATTKWIGDWGTLTGQYGEILCSTCHDKTTTNIKRIKTTITASSGSFPGGAVTFTTTTTPNGFGDDIDPTGHTTSTKVCEVCHSTTNYHRYDTTAQADLTHNNNADCITCHNHNNGFIGAGDCVSCHSSAQGTGSNRRKVLTSGGDIGTDSGKTSYHINAASTAIDTASCEACHLQTNHQGETDPGVRLANPDTGAQINYTGTNTQLTTFCINCHDSDGATRLAAPTTPFTDSGDTTTIGTGTIYDVKVGHGTGATSPCMNTNCHGNFGGVGTTTTNPKLNAHGSTVAKIRDYATAWPDVTNNANHNLCTACHTIDDLKFVEHTGHGGMDVPCLTCHIAKPHGFTSARNATNRGHLLTDGTSVPSPYRGAVNVIGDGSTICVSGTNCYAYIVSFAASGSWATSSCEANTATGDSGATSMHSNF